MNWINYDPDAYVAETRQERCPFHEKYPDIPDYPGCTCMVASWMRLATPEEHEKNRVARIAREERYAKAFREFRLA